MKFRAPAISCLALVSGAALAQNWNESPDAGDMLYSSQNVFGSGLANINGHIAPGSGDGIDLFHIQITNGSTFSATTAGTPLDTMLFLFDNTGKGVAANDDIGFLNTASRLISIPGLVAGDYYLGLGLAGSVPKDVNGNPLFVITSGAPAPGPSAGALASWVTGNGTGGDYTIIFQGAGPVPEPMSIIALAGGALALIRRRRAR
jgi:hypothetical protein